MVNLPSESDKRGLIGGDENLLCGMCHVKEMKEEPLVALSCKHVFHAGCVAKRLDSKWAPNKRVSFNYLACPVCKKNIQIDYQVPKINELLNPAHAEKLVWEEEMERLARE